MRKFIGCNRARTVRKDNLSSVNQPSIVSSQSTSFEHILSFQYKRDVAQVAAANR